MDTFIKQSNKVEMHIVNQYEAYIACLNARDLDLLGNFVSDKVIYNSSAIGLTGYRKMLAENYRDIPDLRFNIDLLVSDADMIASRLKFDCRPVGEFLGYRIDGQRIVFHENVFYRFVEGVIVEVWSIVDTNEIKEQIKK